MSIITNIAKSPLSCSFLAITSLALTADILSSNFNDNSSYSDTPNNSQAKNQVTCRYGAQSQSASLIDPEGNTLLTAKGEVNRHGNNIYLQVSREDRRSTKGHPTIMIINTGKGSCFVKTEGGAISKAFPMVKPEIQITINP